LSLFIKRHKIYSHGTFLDQDEASGPAYLAFCEVINPKEQVAMMMLNYQYQLFTQDGVSFSQPYYSRLDWLELNQGYIHTFLKNYYAAMGALADRETYTFWEHLYQVSPHKTHENAWFLMQTRWMLYLEKGTTLDLMKGIPRKWLEEGQTIKLNGVRSYFGELYVKIQSKIKEGYIDAIVKCDNPKRPKKILIRLPHPQEKRPIATEGGEYNPET